MAALDSDRYLQLQRRLDTLLRVSPLTRRGHRRAATELPRAVDKALRRTATRKAVADAAVGDDQDEALHEMRKAAKRARYVREAAEPARGKKAQKLRKQVKKVQSLLGDHNDTVVARPVLRELRAQAQTEGANRRRYYQFTAIDDCTRLRVLKVYPKADQKTAIAFLDHVLDRLPFQVEVIQTDNGAEFQSAFHWHALDKGLQHVYIKPRTPRLNGKVCEDCCSTQRRAGLTLVKV